MAIEFDEHPQSNPSEGAELTPIEEIWQRVVKNLRDPKQGFLSRQAFANVAEVEFADNPKMKESAQQTVRQRAGDRDYSMAHSHIWALLTEYKLELADKHDDEASGQAEFQQKFIETLNQEITDEDHPVWRSSVLANARRGEFPAQNLQSQAQQEGTQITKDPVFGYNRDRSPFDHLVIEKPQPQTPPKE